MKTLLWVMGMLGLLLSGCGAAETFETVSDEILAPVVAAPGEIYVQLPPDAAAPAAQTEGQKLYLGDDYEILLENLPSGDLQRTVKQLSGFSPEALTVVKTRQGELDRYEFVWTCMGEQGQRLGRAVILDDGNYHYCLSVVRDAAGEEARRGQWQAVFSSFVLV